MHATLSSWTESHVDEAALFTCNIRCLHYRTPPRCGCARVPNLHHSMPVKPAQTPGARSHTGLSTLPPPAATADTASVSIPKATYNDFPSPSMAPASAALSLPGKCPALTPRPRPHTASPIALPSRRPVPAAPLRSSRRGSTTRPRQECADPRAIADPVFCQGGCQAAPPTRSTGRGTPLQGSARRPQCRAATTGRRRAAPGT